MNDDPDIPRIIAEIYSSFYKITFYVFAGGDDVEPGWRDAEDKMRVVDNRFSELKLHGLISRSTWEQEIHPLLTDLRAGIAGRNMDDVSVNLDVLDTRLRAEWLDEIRRRGG